MTKGLKQSRNRKQCVSRQWMDEWVRKLRRIRSIRDRFLDAVEIKLDFVLI